MTKTSSGWRRHWQCEEEYPLDGNIIREKARQLYQHFKTRDDTEGSDVQEADFIGFDAKEEEEEEPQAGTLSALQGFQASKCIYVFVCSVWKHMPFCIPVFIFKINMRAVNQLSSLVKLF